MGEPGVGKTSIRHRYMGQGFNFETMSTIGADFALKKLNENTLLQIWDLAGTDSFSSLRKEYMEGAHGAILVYDLSKTDSYQSVSRWVSELKNYFEDNISLVVVGNKADLIRAPPNTILKEDLVSYLQKIREDLGISCPHVETSALTGLNIDQLFQTLLDDIGY